MSVFSTRPKRETANDVQPSSFPTGFLHILLVLHPVPSLISLLWKHQNAHNFAPVHNSHYFIHSFNFESINQSSFTNFITFPFTAIAAFLLGFSLQPNNIAFKATMTPVVFLDEAIQSPPNTVSLNLSFEIHRPRAMDLTEAVSTISTECQELYKIYEPVAIDLFNTASDELVQTYKTYQPLAWELFQNIRAHAMDLLDSILIPTECQQQLYEKHGSFAECPSAPYSLFAYGRIETMAAVSYDGGMENDVDSPDSTTRSSNHE